MGYTDKATLLQDRVLKKKPVSKSNLPSMSAKWLVSAKFLGKMRKGKRKSTHMCMMVLEVLERGPIHKIKAFAARK